MDEECGLRSATIMTEEQLRKLSRNIRSLFPASAHTDDAINDILSTYHRILASAAAPTIPASHRVAAWNTLCALLDRVSASDDVKVRELLWGGKAWSATFDLYLAKGHLARPKSARQLLSCLTSTLESSPASEDLELAKTDVATRLVAGLVQSDDAGFAKTCALALAHLLTKEALTLDIVLRALPASFDPLSPLAGIQQLLLSLFAWMGRADFGSVIGHLVSVVLDQSSLNTAQSDCSEAQYVPIWASALTKSVRSHGTESASLRAHILPALFKRNAPDCLAFLRSLGVEHLFRLQDEDNTSPETDDELLYAALLAARDLGLIRETEDSQLRIEPDCLLIPVHAIGSLLHNASPSSRLGGLTLLITSHAATRPLPRMSLRLIKFNLHHFFAESDANFRSEVFSLFQRLVDRVRAITAMVARLSSNKTVNNTRQDRDEANVTFGYHRSFLEWLISFLQWELRSTASYQKHISALKCLTILARSGIDDRVQDSNLAKSAMGETTWSFHICVLTKDIYRLLLDFVSDPFDDVRQMSAAILAMYPVDNVELLASTQVALTRAESTMLATGRADQADGVAHLYRLSYQQRAGSGHALGIIQDLLQKLEHMLEVGRADLVHAVARYPMHGLLTSLRYVLLADSAVFPGVMKRLSACLHDVWMVVKPTLCNDAPEGYLPEGLEEAMEVTTKDTLSYCWRALKEASLLLAAMVSYSSTDSELKPLCELCFVQLAELRHRGAFSTVAQSWTVCCLQSGSLSSLTGEPLLQTWYNQVLAILRSKTTINTRRSAGLPSLICGILVADGSGELLSEAFVDLEAVAREVVDPQFAQEGSLPQVHAMNCMKDILKNSRLGEQSERYIPNALRLAADALRSAAWAIRNCGLMLFRAIIDRLLGTSDAYLEEQLLVPKKLSSAEHPQLLEIVLELLPKQTDCKVPAFSRPSEGVFPALQLLQRLVIPSDRLPTVQQAVRALLGSPVWHVRDKAARTYISLVEPKETLQELDELLRTSTVRQNALHGALLAAKYLVRASHAAQASVTIMDSHTKSCMESVDKAAHLYFQNPCDITRAAYLDLCSESVSAYYTAAPAAAATVLLLLGNTGFTLDTLRAELNNTCCINVDRGTAAAVTRPALARLLASSVLLSEEVTGDGKIDRVIDTIEILAKHDGDSCIKFAQHLIHIIRAKALSKQLRCSHRALICRMCQVIQRMEGLTAQVHCAFQELLLSVAHLADCSDLHVFQDLEVEKQIPGTFSPDFIQRNADLDLRLRASSLDRSAKSEIPMPEGLSPAEADWTRRLPSEVSDWTECCVTAVAGAGLHTREAAALAISSLHHLWQEFVRTEALQQPYCRLCFAVHDLLNDDDEDIRELAAVAASDILSTQEGYTRSTKLVPEVARQRLISRVMLHRWHSEPNFIREALDRAFGRGEQGFPDVKQILEPHAGLDTALFAEEKQNLYIDEAQEVRVWSHALLRVPAHAIPGSLILELSKWTSYALRALIDHFTSESDGALGWTTKPETFVLGLQVLYAAELLLHCVDHNVRLPVRPSTIRKLLAELVATADAKGVNALWRTEMLRILSKSAKRKLQRVHALAQEVARWLRLPQRPESLATVNISH